MCRRPVFSFCLYLFTVPPALLEKDSQLIGNFTEADRVCDDGKIGIDAENSKCQGEPLFQYDKLLKPLQDEECVATIDESTTQCIDTPLTYDEHPPSSGDYRPLRPKYGEYDYLPPQRWLASLQYGAVVFLYHPCTPQDQVAQLRHLAQTCLWRHLITPYPHLDYQWPMAVVSWGCVLRVKWVESEAVREWVESHALHTPLAVTSDGEYDDGLLHPALNVSVDGREVVCPSLSSPHTLTNITQSTNLTQNTLTNATIICQENDPQQRANHTGGSPTCPQPPTTTNQPSSSIPTATYHSDKPLHHHIGYTILLGLACTVLLTVSAVYVWNVCSEKGHRRRQARYKSSSRFFPFSYTHNNNQDGSGTETVAIPEYGLPKAGQAEREMLLNQSDEDEI